jgi:hypothetical protein
MHFCKRLFPGLEPMTSWSKGNSFTAAPGSSSHETHCKVQKIFHEDIKSIEVIVMDMIHV